MQKIALHSVPRSGSTWLGNILNSHPEVDFSFQPLFSYAFKGFLTEKSSETEIDEFFKKIKNSNDSFINQKEGIDKGIIPKFHKNKNTSHVIYKEVRYHYILKNLLCQDKNLKVIGLVRHPMATINSWLNAPKEFKAELGWKIEDEWRFALKKNKNSLEEFNGYEKWKETVQLFLELKNEFPDRFYLLNYDKLLKNCENEVEELFSFCNLELHPQTNVFLEKSSNTNTDDAYSVFKKKENDHGWKNTLPEFIVNEIKADEEFQHLNSIFQWI